MSSCLNSANGIMCHGCGKEVHESKVMKSKGYITVNFTLKERHMDSGESSDTCTPSYNLTVCGIECLKKVNWDKVFAEIKRHEKELMEYDYEAQNEKTGIE